eukprot:320909-Chlamydomonas_euryale.AAC.5
MQKGKREKWRPNRDPCMCPHFPNLPKAKKPTQCKACRENTPLMLPGARAPSFAKARLRRIVAQGVDAQAHGQGECGV